MQNNKFLLERVRAVYNATVIIKTYFLSGLKNNTQKDYYFMMLYGIYTQHKCLVKV